MREIKFSYIYQHDDTGRILDERFDIHEIELETMRECFISRYTLISRRQYTGLKDKNSVEIYEGDILKCFGDIAKVVWDNSDAMYRYIYNSNGEKYMEILGTHSYENFEVIGNIYENLDLVGG